MANEVRAEIRVLLVYDHRVVAEGLAMVLEADASMQVVGTAGTVADATQRALDFEPDVIVTDDTLPDGSVDDLARAIRPHLPETPMVVLSTHDRDEALLQAVQAGARAFVPKTEAVTTFIETVRRAAAGEVLIPAKALVRLVGLQRSQDQGRVEKLLLIETITAREQQVLYLMAQGLDNRAVADRLAVTYATVRTHVRNILEKLGAHSKLEALARATQYGLVAGASSPTEIRGPGS